MNRMKKNCLLLLFAIALSACIGGSGLQQVKVEGRYMVTLPTFLEKSDRLNEEASLQMENALKEFYVVIIDEPKSEMDIALAEGYFHDSVKNDLETYSQLIFDNYEVAFTNPEFSEVVDTTIHNMKAKVTTLTATLEELNIFYTIGVIEGENDYYQVLTWTLIGRRKKHESQMNAILHSLQEL